MNRQTRSRGAAAKYNSFFGNAGVREPAEQKLSPFRINKEEAMTQSKLNAITRRKLLLASAAVPLCAILTRPAGAAEFSYKLATGQDPTHPVNIRAKEALDRIREATSGRLEINLFPANQLGSDTDLLTQVRNGSVEFFNLATSILATFVPAASLPN